MAKGNITMRNTRITFALAAAATAAGLIASACGGSSGPGTQTTTKALTSATSSTTAAATTTSQGTASAAPNAGADLQSLLAPPPNAQQTKGPDNIADNGIHMYYQVNGSPKDVIDAYKTALEGKGWQMTPIVTSNGGATYTGTNGNAYGVFDAGGFGTTTYVDACTWPTKPANPNCGHGDR